MTVLATDIRQQRCGHDACRAWRLSRLGIGRAAVAAVLALWDDRAPDRRTARPGAVPGTKNCPERRIHSEPAHIRRARQERPDRLPGWSVGEAPMMAVLDPEALLELDDAAFREVVNQHVPKRSDPDGSVWKVLHDPALIERTYTALVEMVRETDSLLTTRAAELEAFRQECYRRGEPGRRDWFEAEAEHKVWRGRALGWKRMLEPRLMVAKERRRQARIDRNAQQFPRDDHTARAALSRLALAVHRHQVASKAEDINPEPHDEALWAALDQITAPYGELMVTLRSLIDSGAWK